MILQAIILGIVEGITEFLPISSTGHLILVQKFLYIPPLDFWKSFDIIIQFGAILSVVFLYFKKIISNKKLLYNVAVAFIPSAAIGLAFYELIKKYLLGNADVVIWSLLIGGVVILLLERFCVNKKGVELDKLSYLKSFKIGLFQSIAMIPGVSRSAATIFGGMSLGLSRSAIVEFSFLLAIPTMAGAAGLDLIRSDWSFSSYEWLVLAVGFATAFITALCAIKFLLFYVQKHDFKIFGWYRILLALICLFLLK